MTGVAVSRLGFGCVPLTSFSTPAGARRLLEGVFDLGIRHFDTAPAYGRGYSEKILGDFLRGRRDQVTITTKFGLGVPNANLPVSVALPLNALRRRSARPQPQQTTEPPEPEPVAAPPRPWISRGDLERAFDSSRRALGTDHIDIYLLHENVPAALEPSAIDFLQGLRSAGKVGRLGLAANGRRYLDLRPEDLGAWDVLQYESGPGWPAHNGLPEKFPDQMHIFHSCLKDVPRKGPQAEQTASAVLAERLRSNPRGLVLFSSTKLAHVEMNIRRLEA